MQAVCGEHVAGGSSGDEAGAASAVPGSLYFISGAVGVGVGWVMAENVFRGE